MSAITQIPTRNVGTSRLAKLIGGVTAKNMLATGVALTFAILFVGFVAPFIYTPDPYAIHPINALEAPSLAFPLGTDELGRNELALLLSGGFYTLIIALPSAAIAFFVGILYGLLSGLGPSWLDKILMRLLDAVLALPSLVILIFFASIVPPSNSTLILLLGFISWPPLARLVRNETLAQKNRDFVLATEQLGASTFYIARVHLFRVMAPILVVNGTFMVGDSVLALSALSFLGLGVQPPYESWGSLLETGLDIAALDPWWMIIPPGMMIFGSLLAASLTGQGLLAKFGGTR